MENLAQKPIVLVGLMGAGKTVLGRKLAARLQLPFIDLDSAIEQRAGKTIRALFAEDGEEAFRALEETLLEEILLKDPHVLATGGGAVLSAKSRKLLKEKAFTIWLQAEPKTIFARIGKDPARPLLQKENPEAELQKLLEARRGYYSEAQLHFNTEGPREEMVEALVAAVQNAEAKG